MTGRKRPSGNGTGSTRFAHIKRADKTLKIPVVKDTGTFIYYSEDFQWPKQHVTMLLTDAAYLDEGFTFNLKDAIPGSPHGMGSVIPVVVVAVRVTVVIHPGRFGQVERHVLVNPAPSLDDLNAEFTDGA